MRSDDECRADGNGEHGIALVVTLMVTLLLAALAGALIPIVSAETRIAANHRRAAQCLYAAEAALAWSMQQLRDERAISARVGSVPRSSFRVGSRWPRLPDGTRWDLEAFTVALRRDGAGPHGAGRGLPWRLHAYGPLSALLPDDPSGGLLTVAVWVADGGGRLVVHAAAVGPAHLHRAVQATLRSSQTGGGLTPVSWVVVR